VPYLLHNVIYLALPLPVVALPLWRQLAGAPGSHLFGAAAIGSGIVGLGMLMAVEWLPDHFLPVDRAYHDPYYVVAGADYLIGIGASLSVLWLLYTLKERYSGPAPLCRLCCRFRNAQQNHQRRRVGERAGAIGADRDRHPPAAAPLAPPTVIRNAL